MKTVAMREASPPPNSGGLKSSSRKAPESTREEAIWRRATQMTPGRNLNNSLVGKLTRTNLAHHVLTQ